MIICNAEFVSGGQKVAGFLTGAVLRQIGMSTKTAFAEWWTGGPAFFRFAGGWWRTKSCMWSQGKKEKKKEKDRKKLCGIRPG